MWLRKLEDLHIYEYSVGAGCPGGGVPARNHRDGCPRPGLVGKEQGHVPQVLQTKGNMRNGRLLLGSFLPRLFGSWAVFCPKGDR